MPASGWRAQGALLAAALRPRRAPAAGLAGLLLASIALELVGPQVLRAFIDLARAGASARTLTLAALLFLAVAVGAQLVAGLASYAAEAVGWAATNELRAELVRHCLMLGPGFFAAHTPGELIERVDGDVVALADFFARFVASVLGNGLLLLGILVLVAREDWRIGAALAVYAAVSLLVLRRAQARAVPAFAAARQATAEMSGFWGEHLDGLEDVAASGAAGFVLRRFFALQRRLNRAHTQVQLAIVGIGGALTLLAMLGTVLALTLGALFYARGTLTLGTVFLLYAYTALLVQRVVALNEQVDTSREAAASLARIAQLRDTSPLVRDGPGVNLPAGPLAIELRDVTFGYTPETPVLRDLSFALAPGEVVGLVGHSGAGKTTLTRRLLRLADPAAGVVLLGGHDMRQARLDDLRGRIACVTQEVRLFQASVRANLTFFASDIADEQLLAAIERLGLDAWLARLPRGLDTELAAGSAGLSAGEAQLLAFIRVLLCAPQVVVLDEASSRLDPATEQMVSRATERLLRGRTGILIAHRLATVERVDRILVLDSGRLVEDGSPAALARDPGSRYAALRRAAEHAGGVLA